MIAEGILLSMQQSDASNRFFDGHIVIASV
jgi:hypothetical protein